MRPILAALLLLFAAGSAHANTTVSGPITFGSGLSVSGAGVVTFSGSITGFTSTGSTDSASAAGFQNELLSSGTAAWAGGINMADILRGINIVGSSTLNTLTQVNTIGLYTRNQLQSSGSGQFTPAALGIFSIGTCETTNCNTFAADFLVQDYAPAASTSSFTGAHIHALELDINTGNSHTIASGLTVTGASSVQPAQLEAVYVNSPSIQSPGTVLFDNAFRTDDTCCTKAALIGATATSANKGSQPIVYRTYNNSDVLKTLTQQVNVAAGVASLDFTSDYTNFNVGINTTSPADNTATGFSGLSVNGSVGSTLSVMSAGSEFGRFIGISTAAILSSFNSVPLVFQTNATTAMQMDSSQNVLLSNTSALATNAVSPFAYISTSAGAPTGVPGAAAAGRSAITIDSTNHKICWYESAGGAWKCALGS